MIRRIATMMLTLGTICGTIAFAGSVRPIAGPVVFARGGSSAAYIWDATAYVNRLTADHLLGSAGLRAIEATAVSALSQKAKSSIAKTLELSVVYRPLSRMSIYGRPVFAGQEKLVIVTLPRADAAAHGAGWAQDVASGRTPPQVSVHVVGKLPPSR